MILMRYYLWHWIYKMKLSKLMKEIDAAIIKIKEVGISDEKKEQILEIIKSKKKEIKEVEKDDKEDKK